MRTIRKRWLCFSICLLTGAMFGCLNLGSGTRNITRFFLLDASVQQKKTDLGFRKAIHQSLGIGPVSIPNLLDRRQIVTRVNDTEVHVAPFSRWAEPLAENISRVLSENVSLILNTDQVFVHPWFGSLPDYQVKIDVIRFDSPLKGEAILSAGWQVIKTKERTVVYHKRSTFLEPIDVTEIGAMIPVLGRLLEKFSNEIATAMVDLMQ